MAESQTQSQRSHKGSFRILVATDNHIGFKEDHHIRGEDSFDAFEEILHTAKRNKVDFILLGGDLFHELTPSQTCLYRTIKLMQKYVFGGGDLNFETKTLAGPYPANYLNENLNIDLPIFVIHGNHDYPLNASEGISTLDLLHASKLINYFGKFKNLDELNVEPILFEKGPVRIALYGIGHIKDTRLHYLFEKKKVNFIPPPGEDYMTILIIHQNRFKGIRPGAPYKNCVHPTMLPAFIDLVIWGNEHESTDELVEDPVQNFYIYQPGSSIPTSLNQAEALPKHAGFFEISEKKNFRFIPIPLKNQRPLYVKNLELEQLVDNKKPNVFQKLRMDEEHEDIEKKIEEKIEEEFNKILEEHENNVANQKRLKNPPLVRLKVEYSGFDIIRIKQTELKFMGKVANEGDVLKFWRKQSIKKSNELKKNKKLGVEFEDALRQKISLETLTSESNEVIKDIFEDLLQNAKAKPKVLFSQSLFTQSANQRFTLQAVSTQIGEALDYAKKQLVAEKILESQGMSRKILQKENEYIRSQYANGDSFLEDFNTQIKEYDQHMQAIPKYLMSKLQEYTEKRVPEDMIEGAKKEEEKHEDEEEEEKETTGRKKKGGAQKGKKASVSKKGVKKEDGEEKKTEEDDDDLEAGLGRMNIEDNRKWDMYEHNSEEDEKEWFKGDFGRGVEAAAAGGKKGATKKNAEKKPAEKKAEKPKGRGKGKAKKDSDEGSDDDYSDITANTPAKKRGGKRRTVIDDEEEEMEDESPLFKKTKKTPTPTPPPAQTNTQNKSKASKPINKFFL